MQELTTEYCWGAVWGREILPHKIRSMLNLAMISCLNGPHELKNVARTSSRHIDPAANEHRERGW